MKFKFILPVLLMTSTQFAHGQVANMPAPMPAPATLKPIPPKKTNTFISAFRAWGKLSKNKAKETNMAEMVMQSLISATRGNEMSRINPVNSTTLEVNYDTSSEALIDAILRQNEPPEMIISIGQGSGKITIETGAMARPSSIRDTVGRNRNGQEFAGLPSDLGLNFPVQDMWCSLQAKERSKVDVSYVPGSFVCNDLAYYMANFSQGLGYAQRVIGQMENSNNYVTNNKLESLKSQLEMDLKIEAQRLAADPSIMENAKRNFEAQMQAYNARVAAQEQQVQQVQQQVAPQANYQASQNTYGPPSSYGNSNNYQGSQGSNFQKPPFSKELPPVFVSPDQSENIKRNFESKKYSVKNEYEREARRIERFKKLFSLEKPIPFIFIHVPVSDGVDYQPIYKLENAACLPSNTPIPASSGNIQWMDGDRAASLLRKNVQDLNKQAVAYVSKAGANNRPYDECMPKLIEKTVYNKLTGKDEKVKSYAPQYARFLFALSGTTSKKELRENSESDGYANLIARMVEGAIQNQEHFRGDSRFPLPTFKNGKTMPRGEDTLKAAKATMMSMTQPALDKNKNTIAPSLTAEQAACYSDFVDEILKDRRQEGLKKDRGADIF